MNGRKRLHREDPSRVAPIRDLSKLYSGKESSNSSVGSESESTVGPMSGRSSDGDSQPEGIALAYRIVEKHLKEGRRSAEQFNKGPYSTRAATGGLGELLERMLRYQAEMLPLWIEILGNLVKVDPASGPYSSMTNLHPDDRAPHNGSSVVSIEILSSRPVEVSLELREQSAKLALQSLGLRSVEAGKPELTDVSFMPEPADGARKLRIRIPDGQPAGTYSGVIVERGTGRTRGTLSVCIGA